MSRRLASAPADAVHVAGWLDERSNAFAEAMDEVQSRLHRLELEVIQLGVAIAPLYLASARGSLRHVTDCVIHQRGVMRNDAGTSNELCPGASLRLMPLEGREGIGERFARSASGCGRVPEAEAVGHARRPDLGADLLASPEATAVCRGPVGAAMLFDALSRHRWMHGPSSTKWATDVSGAHALVSAIAGGACFPKPGLTSTGGLVDREVADLLAHIGWYRMVSTRMPG